MKKYLFFALLLIGALTSCRKKELTAEEKHYVDRSIMCKTWKITKLTERYGTDTIVWNIAKNPEIQAKWVLDLVWSDGYGWNMGAEDIGNGKMFRPFVYPYDLTSISGPRVLQDFKWYFTDDLSKSRGVFGGNVADAQVIDYEHATLHQLDGPVERWYELGAASYGWGMEGKGFTRPD